VRVVPDPRVHVDFNEVDEDGLVAVLRTHAEGPDELSVGTVVQLFDEDGNTALGRVDSTGPNGLLWTAVLWDSWSAGGSAHGEHDQETLWSLDTRTPDRLGWELLSVSASGWTVINLRVGRASSHQPTVHLVSSEEPATSGR